MNRFLHIYHDATPAGNPTGGQTPPAGGQTTPPVQTPPAQTPPPAGGQTPPVIDPNVISASARTEMARSLGFSSVEEMKSFIQAGKTAPSKKAPSGQTTPPDIKELQQKIEIYQKTSDEIRSKYKKTLIENAFHSAFNTLGVQVHSIEDLKSIALNSLDVTDDDKIIIKNSTGDVMLNQKGERMTISEHIGKILNEKPWLIKNAVKPGIGIIPGQTVQQPGQPVTLEELSKKGSFTLDEFKAAMGKK